MVKLTKKDLQLIRSFSYDCPSDLVFWSFRYFMGRRTIQTCCFAEGLAAGWPYLSERVQTLIKGELEREFERDDRARVAFNAEVARIKKSGVGTMPFRDFPLGHDCDRQAWEKVRAAYREPA